MAFDSIEQNDESWLSLEQREQLDMLVPIAAKFFESSINKEDHYADMETLKASIENPEQYFLWSLLEPGHSPNIADYQFFDDDGKIARFIESLEDGELQEAA